MQNQITDADEIAAYVASAHAYYGAYFAMELADPPVVVKTASGARVMAWLPIEDEDLVQAIKWGIMHLT